MDKSEPIWQPSSERIAQANITRYMDQLSQQGLNLDGYPALHQWSIEEPERFWGQTWEFCGVVGSQGKHTAILGEPRWQQSQPNRDTLWFPEAKLNYAENLLKHTHQQQDTLAIWFENELGEQTQYTWQTLYDDVSRVQQWLMECGVTKGDTVAAYTPYLPEVVVAMLAATSLGATWTSTSPDFGVESVLERFGQVQPKVLFTCDGYSFNGKHFDMSEKNHALSQQISGLEQVCQISYANKASAPASPSQQNWQAIISSYQARTIEFTQVSFNEPLFVLYSSGTTGKPKCIVHSVGGTLLNHLKEHQLHCDIKPHDRVFYYTTCGWMMWNWHVSALASGVCLVIFDGSPMCPNPSVLWDLAARADVSLFGTSAKYLEALEKVPFHPAEHTALPALKTLCSTGSVLYPEQFDFVYQSIKSDLHLASISGGTDICGCFVLGNPISPVYRGECQAAGLAVDVRVFSSHGEAITEQRGELVCCNSLPNFPNGFWNDNGERYHDTYWSRFEDTWHHGDDVKQSDNRGFVFFGRRDATLNPGGVRIGTAEIYQQVNHIEGIVDSIAVGKAAERNEEIWLFVQLESQIELTEPLKATIKSQLKSACSPRHVPSQIFVISDIPKTRSGKLVELAVKQVVNGNLVENIGAIANAEVLKEIEQMITKKG
ncbi:acetoacetyl-CoA synthetase [Vibrio fortis]|uniref:Acetoacetyl-CoA synthetase n=1 Tax=Vibrio fortis TaxID=212667 RepID=A0A066UKM7_9VIBR|nr:acetoacetate--CoA ligase [Vibrio fortis]KDN26442.1 acetoacetyl-CoA synthetase [Vibrio fortis]